MQTRLGRLMRAAFIVMMLTVLLCGEALASISCYINTSTKIYNRPSTSAASITVPKNLSCSITAMSGNWAMISRDGVSAFIPMKYLTLNSRLTAYTTRSVSMYTGASSSSKKLGTLPKGTAVYINGRDGSYFRVQDKSGSITGYISASYLSPTKPKPTTTKPASPSATSKPSATVPTYSPDMSNAKKLEYVIYVAQSLSGRPYASNANVPYSFDCSRFVRYCFEQIEIVLDASAKEQGYDDSYTRITNTGSLKAGDVVVFNTNATDGDSSDHTGIYIGNGYFIHASSSAGKVIVSTLASGYYNNTFSWGLRILG